jgi:GxxExxY protein
MGTILQNKDVLFPDVSYDVIGSCFDAYNGIGAGKSEKTYQKAVEIGLEKRKRKFVRQVHCPIVFEAKRIGDFFLDLLVEDLVVVELKVGERFKKQDYDQIKTYLCHTEKKLGILVRFSDEGVVFCRVLNPSVSSSKNS